MMMIRNRLEGANRYSIKRHVSQDLHVTALMDIFSILNNDEHVAVYSYLAMMFWMLRRACHTCSLEQHTSPVALLILLPIKS